MSKNFIDGADDARRLLYLDPVTASLASIPGRAHMLPATIASLLPQVDRINVMLNEYDHVPDCLNHPKIVVERSQNVGNFYSDAMFWWVDEVKGYHFFCADDLVYHPDYVASMIPWIEWYERKTTLTCHAVIIDPDPKDYYRCRKVYHGMTPSSEAHWCNVGCIAYHTDTLKLTRQQMCLREVSDPREHNMSDIIIAIEHQKQRVPCLGIARNFQPYSMPIHDVGIYEHSRSRDKSVWDSADIQTKAVQGFGKWELFTIDEMLNPHDAQNQFEDPMAVVESTYWSRRYRDGGNSGKGSYGEEAAFKSDTIASIAAKFEVQSVVDFGIGDGSMVSNIQRKLKPNTQYLGFDISPVAVNAIKRTNHDGVFEVGDVASGSIEAHADMALCIDVFFHLMSAERQTKAMETICNSFGKVAIVSALNQKPAEPMAAHCSYWPMKIPEGIRLVEEIVLPMNPKLSLYVLSR